MIISLKKDHDPIDKIHFVASETPEAQAARALLIERYGNASPEEAETVVALGGDGLMLQTLHEFMGALMPIYGMNRGSVGFLMNDFSVENLPERLAQAKLNMIYPLRMRAILQDGPPGKALAINEVSLFRRSHQAARLRISVDGKVRLEELICDGVLVATPAGSTAYNLSVHGPILPINTSLLALTPISPFRPRRWRGALLPSSAMVVIEVLEPEKRPMSAVADHTEFRNVLKVEIAEERGIGLRLLFDPGHELDERILAEQFRY
ncbi:MAG: NAD kinase [Rhodomicrobiaceae bacterium]